MQQIIENYLADVSKINKKNSMPEETSISSRYARNPKLREIARKDDQLSDDALAGFKQGFAADADNEIDEFFSQHADNPALQRRLTSVPNSSLLNQETRDMLDRDSLLNVYRPNRPEGL